MCIAIPGKIIEISNTQATVNIMEVEMSVNIQLINEPKIGDYVLVHAGCAIEKVDQVYFNDLSDVFNSIWEKDERKDG